MLEMEIYPSGVNIKYIICKLIDSPCIKHALELIGAINILAGHSGFWILSDARLIISPFNSNKKDVRN